MLKADKEAFLPLPTPLSSHVVLGSMWGFVGVCTWASGKGKWEDEEGDALAETRDAIKRKQLIFFVAEMKLELFVKMRTKVQAISKVAFTAQFA